MKWCALFALMSASTYRCGNVSSFLKIFRISSPSNINNKSGCPIRPPTFAILPYCLFSEYITLSKSWIRYWPICRTNELSLESFHSADKWNIKHDNDIESRKYFLFLRTKLFHFYSFLFVSYDSPNIFHQKQNKIHLCWPHDFHWE